MPDLGQIAAFFLVFLRAAAFLTAGPLYAIKGMPPLLKVGFSLILAIVVFPVVELQTPLPEGNWGFGLAVLSETGVGLLLGLAVTMVLNSIKMAGQFIDLQIGYAMATLIDPTNGSASSLISQYYLKLSIRDLTTRYQNYHCTVAFAQRPGSANGSRQSNYCGTGPLPYRFLHGAYI